MGSPRVLDGRYELVEPLGQGATGRVWLAHDLVLDRDVAIKQLIADAPDADTIARAEREAKVAGRLQHPNAVAVHDLVTVDGKPHVVMEYLQGRSLAELARQGGFPVARIAEILAEIASALSAAQELGIVHRDVKPANIVITRDGRAKLADFGIARRAGIGPVTATGLVVGTLAYMAPEVAGGGAATPAADVWSLGATAFALTEGRPPYQADSDLELYEHLVHDAPPRPVAAGALTDLIQRMMQRDPHRRPAIRAVQREMAQIARSAPAPDLSGAPTVALPVVAAVAPSALAPPAPSLPSPPLPAHPPSAYELPAYEPPAYEPLPAIRASTPPAAPRRGDSFGDVSGPGFFGSGHWDQSGSGPLDQFLEDEQPVSEPGHRRRPGAWLVAVVVVAVLVVAGGLAVYLLRDRHGASTANAPTSTSAGVSSARPTVAATARYVAPGGISVTGPAGWTKSPGYEVDRISSFSPAGTVAKDNATYFRFGKGSLTPATDFATVAKESISFIQNSSSYTNKQIVATRDLTYLGVPAVDIEWSGRTPGGSDRHLIQRVWLSKTITWIIQVNFPAAQWDPRLALFTQLTTSCTVS